MPWRPASEAAVRRRRAGAGPPFADLLLTAPAHESSDLPRSIEDLRRAVAAGSRHFEGLSLQAPDAGDLNLAACVFSGGCFKEGRFGHACLQGADVEGVCFQQALFWGSDLSELKGRGSQWHDADLSGSRMQGADLQGAILHRCCLRGVVAPGSHWQGARLVEADFRSGLDQLTDLGMASFRGADLSFARLDGARLPRTDFREACLYGASLRRADLSGADLSGCDLRDTCLEGARLEGARFDGARLPPAIPT
ncbi:pentapeptide repeat-containing protein [Synechococcus sp. RSCCF101]|nr:pentapeptide repeat-containing protein [Synechococcus sp. RSCCF101]